VSLVRIAMWSGPRNISTALMRSFENRPDTVVWDEPLYAYFLDATGIDHPLREETLQRHERDPAKVIEACVHGPVPAGRTVFYQKHMTHHFLPDLPWDWLDGLHNCFLIRDPKAMLLSYSRKRGHVTADDLGLARQREIFDFVRTRTGRIPPVLDAEDVLRDPRHALTELCAALGLTFTEQMLSWPPGPRRTDGAWAAHWYDAVLDSTGFAAWRPREGTLTPALAAVHAESAPHYEALRRHRIGIAGPRGSAAAAR
jgi:hypothetical protein